MLALAQSDLWGKAAAGVVGAKLLADAVQVDPLSALVSWGPPGVVVLLIVTGQLVTKGHADEIRAQRDASQKREAELVTAVREQVRLGDRMLDKLDELLRRPPAAAARRERGADAR